ncbi:MAG: hypothetical protein IJP16_05325 [Clostridia bacterium]|nr:hypothetical protein [Clostridia bacterium]
MKRERERQITVSEDWLLLEKGREYNRALGFYETVDENERFWRGDQWHGVRSGGLPTPVFNVFKRVISYLVSNVMSSKISLKIDAEGVGAIFKQEVREELDRVCSSLSSYLNYRFEKDDITTLLYDGVTDATLTGDMFLYVWWDPEKKTFQDYRGDFRTRLLDATSVFFGDVNTPDVQSQPYIIISGRELVSRLREEARRSGVDERDIERIAPDSDNRFEAGDEGKRELEDTKTGYVIKLWRENGTVRYRKSTKNCVITGDIDTRLSLYPLVLMNWDRTKNSYHGTAAASGIIENQLYINKAFAMVMKHMINVSFSKVVYNANVIDEWTNDVGEAIAVNGPVDAVATTIDPGTMQSGFLDVINMTMSMTRELMGATDAALGNVEATNTSAILALQESSAVPLQVQKRALYTAVESLAMIWLDYILHYYDRYRMMIWREEGVLKGETLNLEAFSDFVFSCSVTAGMSSYWSELASITTLESLLREGHITLEQYLERIPDGYVARRDELIRESRLREEVSK